MRQGTLVPDSAEVELVCLGRVAGAIEMRLKTCRVSATCLACGTSSRKVHSRYVRRLADLPWDGVSVIIRLQTRRFFCVEPGCRRKVFTEPLPGTVARYGRRSSRSSEALGWLCHALGGRAGARLGERLGLLASRSTLLRELHHRRPQPLVGLPVCLASTTGHVARAIAMARSYVILRRARWSTCFLIAMQTAWPGGSGSIPGQRLSAAIAAGSMPKPHAEPLLKPYRLQTAGTFCAT